MSRDQPAPQPPASLVIPALVRQITAAGGFATVLARGSQFGSAMLLVHRWQGQVRAYERLPTVAGASAWRLAADGEEAVDRFLDRQRGFDADLWILELDVAELQRFVPDISTSD